MNNFNNDAELNFEAEKVNNKGVKTEAGKVNNKGVKTEAEKVNNHEVVTEAEKGNKQEVKTKAEIEKKRDNTPDEKKVKKQGVKTESKTDAKQKFFTASRMAKIGIFSALATILYFLKFPISFLFPSFLELNFSDIPALVGSFALGPVSGCIIVLIKVLIKLPFTSTACVGELADLLIGVAFVFPAGLFYKKNRTFKGAVIGILIGTIVSVAMAVISNWLLLIPFFRNVWGMDAIVGAVSVIFKNCTADTFYGYYLPFAVVPFNILRCLLASTVTLLIYKRISKLINKF